MPRIPVKKTCSLIVDDNTIEVTKPSRRNSDLNLALRDPQEFSQFANDPQKFCAKFDLHIDDKIATALKDNLTGIKTLEEASQAIHLPGNDTVAATVWAIASPAYSVSTGKIAVAFVA